jgi:hypothetical protein
MNLKRDSGNNVQGALPEALGSACQLRLQVPESSAPRLEADFFCPLADLRRWLVPVRRSYAARCIDAEEKAADGIIIPETEEVATGASHRGRRPGRVAAYADRREAR